MTLLIFVEHQIYIHVEEKRLKRVIEFICMVSVITTDAYYG